jgi:hypothetical protein
MVYAALGKKETRPMGARTRTWMHYISRLSNLGLYSLFDECRQSGEGATLARAAPQDAETQEQ